MTESAEVWPNNAFDRTPESIAALRGRSRGGAGQGERYALKNALDEMEDGT